MREHADAQVEHQPLAEAARPREPEAAGDVGERHGGEEDRPTITKSDAEVAVARSRGRSPMLREQRAELRRDRLDDDEEEASRAATTGAARGTGGA